MGTPRVSAFSDQMRNVQRTASCGDANAHDKVRTEESCRSNEILPGAKALSVATQAVFNSGPETLFPSGCETGADFLEIAQQVLLAQQAG